MQIPNLKEAVLLLFLFYCLLFVFSVVKTKLKSPEKSWKNCIINIALYPVRLLKLGPYKGGERRVRDVNEAIKYAMKKTKLNDLGPDNSFVSSFQQIMNSKTQKSQHFTNLGYISGDIELKMNFVRRLKLVQYLKDVPAVKQIPVISPVFVMGLPRTGTTFMHRLLSMDPAVRAPLTWELLAPIPNPTANPLSTNQNSVDHVADREVRKNYIKKLLATRRSMGDSALEHIHEVGYDLPEECLLGLTDEFPVMLQFLYSDYMEIEKILSMDAKKAYLWYKQILQLLSYQVGEIDSPRRWTLKCPIHLFFIKQLAQAYPDAKVVWTHRHPVSAVTSMCSLIKAIHSVYYSPDGMDMKQLGRNLKKVSENVLQQATIDIKESGLEHYDIRYADMIKDPIGAVKKIYDQFGWEMSQEYKSILNRYIDENKRQRELMKKEKNNGGHALHHYDPETYGLSAEELSSGGFAEYVSNYNVPFDNT